MQDALSRLNDKEFIDASDDYRNKFNHGFPRRIEYGHSMVIERAENTQPSDDISNLISMLEQIPDEMKLEISDQIAALKMIKAGNRKVSCYAIIDAPPLYISNLIPTLEGQYKAAVNCHEAYVSLIREQHKIWISLPSA